MDQCRLRRVGMSAIQRISKAAASSHEPPRNHSGLLLFNLHAAGT